MKPLNITIALALIFTASVHAQDEIPSETSSAEELLVGQQPVDLFARDTYRIDTIICPFKGEIDYEPGTIEKETMRKKQDTHQISQSRL